MTLPQLSPVPSSPEEPAKLSEISSGERLSHLFCDVLMCMIRTAAPMDRDLRIQGSVVAVKFESLASELERLGKCQISYETMPEQPIQMIGLLQIELARQVAALDPKLEKITKIANRCFLVDSIERRLKEEGRPGVLREYAELGRNLLLVENNLNAIRTRLAAE